MKQLAVFYHCRLSCDDPKIDFDHASSVMEDQMNELINSGLAAQAGHLFVGVNGGPADYMAALCLVPQNAVTFQHPSKARGEVPTMIKLQEWLPGHEDWYVCYFHLKSAMYKGDAFREAWRRRMQNAVVINWRRCVADLDSGADAVGCHWLTPEQYPGLMTSPYFGGTFWWAKASFLMTLPPLPAPTWENRYHAESWIGTGPRRPVIRDYHPGWPM